MSVPPSISPEMAVKEETMQALWASLSWTRSLSHMFLREAAAPKHRWICIAIDYADLNPECDDASGCYSA